MDFALAALIGAIVAAAGVAKMRRDYFRRRGCPRCKSPLVGKRVLACSACRTLWEIDGIELVLLRESPAQLTTGAEELPRAEARIRPRD